MDFEVIGTGTIGDKAQQLYDKTARLKEIGFHVPRRTILAQDFFDGFFQRNELGDNMTDVEITADLEERIRKGSLTADQFETLQRVTASYTGPLAVRSSAQGAARGTGTYTSEFSLNHAGKVGWQLRKVLASYFSESAVAFRRDSGSGEGFAVMIEPIVGQPVRWGKAPMYSGFGYTSTSKGVGYINMVSGMLGGVASREGSRITETFAQECDDDLLEMAYQLTRQKPTLEEGPLQKLATDPSGYIFMDDYERVGRGAMKFPEGSERGRDYLKLLPFFDMMKRMEDAFATPQYFEWAVTVEEGKPQWYILQIADVAPKTDIFEFGADGDVIFDCHTVTGSGMTEATKIFNCWNPDDVGPLYEFNQHNDGYVLLFSSRLTTEGALGRIRQLEYADFSNASVFVEIQDAVHTGDPVAHLGGQLDETGKLFGVLNFNSHHSPNFDLLRSREQDEYGSRVYQGKVKAIASEAQDRMQVITLDENI